MKYNSYNPLSLFSIVFILLVLPASSPVEWETKKISRFTVLYLPQSSKLAESILPHLGPELDRVSRLLKTEPPAMVTVVVTPDRRSFIEVQGGGVAPWVSGTAYPARSKIFLRPLSGAEVRHTSLNSVISHEFAHIVLHHKLSGHTPPRWLDEGMAVYMGKEPLYARAEKLLPIGIFGRNTPFRRLQDQFPDTAQASATAYAQSGDFVRFLFNEYGSEAVFKYLELMARGKDPDEALQAAFDSTLYDLEQEWLREVRIYYGFLPALSGGSLLWFLMSLLAILAYLRKNAEVKRRREQEAAINEEHWTGRVENDDDLSGLHPKDKFTLH